MENNRYAIELCKQMLAYVYHSEKTENMRLSQTKVLLSFFFEDDIIDLAVEKLGKGL